MPHPQTMSESDPSEEGALTPELEEEGPLISATPHPHPPTPTRQQISELQKKRSLATVVVAWASEKGPLPTPTPHRHTPTRTLQEDGALEEGALTRHVFQEEGALEGPFL